MAPCFVRMHNQLRHRKHLKFEARYQYRCLLNARWGRRSTCVIAIGKERFMSDA